MASDQTQLYGDITGKRIKRHRIDLGLTQKELAEKINVTPATINKYETGITPIPRKRLQDIGSALDVSPVYLLGFTDDPKPTNKQHTYRTDTFDVIKNGALVIPSYVADEDFKNNLVVKGTVPETRPLEIIHDGGTKTADSSIKVSEEERELLRIYRMLSVRRRMQLLNTAYSLEDEEK